MDTLKEAGRQAARSMKTYDSLDQVADAVTLAVLRRLQVDVAKSAGETWPVRLFHALIDSHIKQLALSPPSEPDGCGKIAEREQC